MVQSERLDMPPPLLASTAQADAASRLARTHVSRVFPFFFFFVFFFSFASSRVFVVVDLFAPWQIRPFVCNVCGEDFAYKHVLKRHMKVHAGDGLGSPAGGARGSAKAKASGGSKQRGSGGAAGRNSVASAAASAVSSTGVSQHLHTLLYQQTQQNAQNRGDAGEQAWQSPADLARQESSSSSGGNAEVATGYGGASRPGVYPNHRRNLSGGGGGGGGGGHLNPGGGGGGGQSQEEFLMFDGLGLTGLPDHLGFLDDTELQWLTN